jgi:Flp pilus assembly protein TadD
MTRRLALLAALAALAAGCHRREITTHDRMEAANAVSEAEFAVSIKDLARAEGLYAKAADLCPDDAETWIRLGVVRVQLHDSDGARKAYKEALAAFKDDFDRDHGHTASVMRAATVLVILGRPDEARSLVDGAYAKVPDDRRLKAFVEAKDLDRIIADPGLKRISP